MPCAEHLLPSSPALGFYSNVLSDEIYELQGVTFTEGRNISLTAPLFKYKLEMIINDPSYNIHNQPYYVVIVCNDEIDLNTLRYSGKFNNGGQFIAPIYARGLGHTYMFTENINTVLAYLDPTADKVISVKAYINEILRAIGAVYDPSVTEGIDIADAGLVEPLVLITNWFAGSNHRVQEVFRHFDGNYFPTRRTLPLEVQMIRAFNQLDQLKVFMSAYAWNVNEVCSNAIRSMSTWPSIQYELLKHDALLIRTSDTSAPNGPEELGHMAKFLLSLMRYNAEDFWFDVDIGPGSYRDGWYTQINTRTGFDQRQNYMKDSMACELPTLLTNAADLITRFPSRCMIAHRSCMEDVSVYDKNDNTLLLYIDLPMWMIASCHGLINASNTYSF